ncbi:MAG: SsrA-binding protein SmpB [Muribaculaceae bacterium]|nr:SsrA-binding protein SmpB [Muribaculaceae bacterium]MDE6696300.1 SsrA-binding protein SmpB [Muribaculaceae bacterium]
MDAKNINIKNRRASFDYEIGDTYTAGMVLTGTEIKSIRSGKASLADSYCIIDRGEVWVKGMNISEYFYGSYNNHIARRDRKLLLSKKEIAKIEKAISDPGYTLIPLRIFINDRGYAKLVVGVARGKKQYDKRQAIKEREDKRILDRMMKK